MKKLMIGVLVLLFVLSLTACGGPKLDWPTTGLAPMLPDPPSYQGDVYSDTDERLSARMEEVSKEQYAVYLASCKEKGFVVEETQDGLTYRAFNADGYKLELTHYTTGELSVTLQSPKDMGEIVWPQSEAGDLLPEPDQLYGVIQWENADGFCLYIGKMPLADYNEYVEACAAAGFTVDYNKGDHYYYADHADDYSLTLRYEGFQTVYVRIDRIEEETTVTTTATTTKAPDSGSVEWREFLRDYEEWVDDYVALVKKYRDNPTDLTLLSAYTEMLADMTEWAEQADDVQAELTSAEDVQEYVETLSRITTKLASVAY